MQLKHFNQNFILSELRAIFWIEKRMLIIADAHFSKEAHFRKNGIAIPAGIIDNDLKRMDTLIETFAPEQILFLGDMFHSEENDGLNTFLIWRNKRKNLVFNLVIGNHDILDKAWYSSAQIACFEEKLQIENILFTHDKFPAAEQQVLNFYGHIHPGIRLHGKAKQSLRLPCFWFNENFAALPAFGRFTGFVSVKSKKEDKIYAIGEGKVFNISQLKN